MSFLRKNWVAIVLLTVGIVFIAVGMWRGEDETVFRKAVNICLECIGLG